jgi:hypothetical protein
MQLGQRLMNPAVMGRKLNEFQSYRLGNRVPTNQSNKFNQVINHAIKEQIKHSDIERLKKHY